VRGSAPSGSPRRVAPLRLQQEQQESLQREKEEAQQKERERQTEEREKEEEREEVSYEKRTSASLLGVCVLLLYSILSFVAQVQRLQGRCEKQERQLKVLRNELRRTSLGLEAFIITTQHYCLKVANWKNTLYIL